MESNSYPDLSPEYSYAHKIAARELAKYCQEFDRWRRAKRGSEGLAQDPRRRGMLVPPLPGRATSPEQHSAH
jgi:hypothetical protein